MKFGDNYIENHLFNILVNNSRSMLSVIDRKYCYERVNNTFCKLHVRNKEEINGTSLKDLWGEDTFKSKIKENIDLCLEGNIVRYEANFDVPLTGNRYYEVVFRPVCNEKGDITHLLAETTDITGLKISQKAVSEMEEEFRRIVTSLPIGLLRCKPDGTIVNYNNALAEMLECSGENNLEGLVLRDFYLEKPLYEIHFLVPDDEKIRTFQRVSLISCKGNIIQCRIRKSILQCKNTGKPEFIDFSFEDLTREIILENKLLLARKLETVGALAGGIAHDFNNIISSIFGYSELLLDELKDNPRASEMTAKIIRAVSKARDLTNQILTFSRQVEQEKIPVHLNEVLEEAVSFIESIKPGNINVKRCYGENDPVVHADPTQLFRVFMNLMMNAVQAMEISGGTLTVTLDMVDGNVVKSESGKTFVADKYVLVKLEDTGTGMDDPVMSRIFEPYFSTKELSKGRGLGLSVVYGIISELEGEIAVRSEKDIGSSFSVYIPIMENFFSDACQDHVRKRRIMFISETRCHESRIISSALGKSGYLIDFESDIKGLSKLADENTAKPDLVVFTHDSTGIDPDFFCKFFQDKKINIPVILITDSNRDLSNEKLLSSGIAKNVLFKPTSLKEIMSAIQISLNY